jgi:hypothetical protein
MRIIRIIFLLLFVSIFIHGKAQCAFKIINDNTISKKKLGDLKPIKVFYYYNKNEKFVINKKQKPKSRVIVSLAISGLSMSQIFIYIDFLIPIFETRYASFLYCVDQKRGPPIN